MSSENIRDFIDYWSARGSEKQDTQRFWIELLGDVLGAEHPTKHLDFEKAVDVEGSTKNIDAYIPETKTLIEQKSRGLSLSKKYLQSDGVKLTPIQQARRYGEKLPHFENPRRYVTCNFEEIRVYDNNRPGSPPEIIKVADLEKDWTRLNFLLDEKDDRIAKEQELSVKAGEIVGKLYDSLLQEYNDPTDVRTLESLNQFIVRIVFLAWAEDSGVLQPNQFRNYMERFRDNPGAFRRELIELFRVLNTLNRDDMYLEDDLDAFPYTNGGLFADNGIEIPRFSDKIIELMLDEMCGDFDWSGISPTIFGAVFESTLNPESRRKTGAHFTSVANIHKVIDPLFLDELKEELEDIKKSENVRGSRTRKLNRFIDRLASLRFLDPACGSGNFITETYISLRKLENEALKELNGIQVRFSTDILNPVKVNIKQFYGIEINDFAVAVANTALFIAEHQMLMETEEILNKPLKYLPLTKFNNIHEGNSLRMDWNGILPADECSYVMGNPPFRGARLMSSEQKQDIRKVFGEKWIHVGDLDYVSGWFKKAADYMKGTGIKAAFVSTNSIIQGSSPANLWKPLFEEGIYFNFAHTSFKWINEAFDQAAVFCVILGFSYTGKDKLKFLFNENSYKAVENINAYLTDGENVFVTSRETSICPAPRIGIGNQPIDGGYYLFKKKEMEEFVRAEPGSKPFFRKWYGSRELLCNKPRYCLWLGDVSPKTIRNMPLVRDRVESVKAYRQKSKRKSTLKLAETPLNFQAENMPEMEYLVIPETSSANRKYIPVKFMSPSVLCSNSIKIIQTNSLYHFGILTSNVHNAWIRAVAGRLGEGYRYSKDIVYNNFVWPDPTKEQKKVIESTAQAILNARNAHPDCSLADLYDELLMPEDLRKAHQLNDKAVMQAYGWPWKTMSEEECVAELMKLYAEKVEKESNKRV